MVRSFVLLPLLLMPSSSWRLFLSARQRARSVLWAPSEESAASASASDGFLDDLRGGGRTDVDVGVDAPNRKSRTWPKAIVVARGGASVDDVGDSGVSEHEPLPTEPGPAAPSGRGGLASSILGSGVWKKAFAAAANVTTAAANATAAATAKAVNSDIAANATAMAASFGAGGEAGDGVWWAGSGGRRPGSSGGDGGGHDAGRHGRRASSRGGGREQVDEAERSEVDGWDWDQNVEEEKGEAAPFLTISVGNVSCFLPDVRWSVQMQQKRFLKVGDSGSVK